MLENGNVLVAGGSYYGDPTNTAEIYNSSIETFIHTVNIDEEQSLYKMLVLINEKAVPIRKIMVRLSTRQKYINHFK